METVEIREDPTFTPYCVVCKHAICDPHSSLLSAQVCATQHELEQHPDPEPEDG